MGFGVMKIKATEGIFKGFFKNKYVLIVLAAGLILLLLPSGGKSQTEVKQKEIEAPTFSLEKEEERLCGLLSKIDGAGRVSVLLSVKGSASRTIAESGEESLVISTDDGEKVVELYYENPVYSGAVVVCQGADDPQVRFNITAATSGFTGLGSNKIIVIRMVQ